MCLCITFLDAFSGVGFVGKFVNSCLLYVINVQFDCKFEAKIICVGKFGGIFLTVCVGGR